MVVILPQSRQIFDGGDRDLGFEPASDEGAYHPCPALTIPPPPVRRPQLDLAQSGFHRSFRQLSGQP